jgi:hypothetical protein
VGKGGLDESKRGFSRKILGESNWEPDLPRSIALSGLCFGLILQKKIAVDTPQAESH